jgi:hypothetical protein
VKGAGSEGVTRVEDKLSIRLIKTIEKPGPAL